MLQNPLLPNSCSHKREDMLSTCRSFIGFQSCSRKMTVSAAVRFRPRPPTLVVSSMTGMLGSWLKRWTMPNLCDASTLHARQSTSKNLTLLRPIRKRQSSHRILLLLVSPALSSRTTFLLSKPSSESTIVLEHHPTPPGLSAKGRRLGHLPSRRR